MANNVGFQTAVTATPSTSVIVESIDEGSGVERQVVTLGSLGKAGGETQITTFVPMDAIIGGNLYNAVTGAIPAQNATTYNTNSYLTGAINPLNADLNGNLYVNVGPAHYNNKANWQQTAGTSTSTAITLLAASGSTGLKEYLTNMQCGNSAVSSVTITLNDTASSVFFVPAGGGNDISFQVPLVAAANTAMTATLSSGVSKLFINAQGYNAA